VHDVGKHLTEVYKSVQLALVGCQYTEKRGQVEKLLGAISAIQHGGNPFDLENKLLLSIREDIRSVKELALNQAEYTI
jgi:hypothetical protein